MAKNWMIPEVYEAIKQNDKEAIRDFGGRFPLTTIAISKLNEDAETLIEAIGSRITVRQIEAILKDGVNETSADDDDDEEEEKKPAKSKAPAETAKRKRRTKAEIEAEKSKDADDDEDSENEYDGMTAQELFKLCKKEGVDAAPKKSTKYYIDLLNAAKEDDSEDDWDAEEEEEKKPVKGKKKPAKEEADDDEWDI